MEFYEENIKAGEFTVESDSRSIWLDINSLLTPFGLLTNLLLYSGFL